MRIMFWASLILLAKSLVAGAGAEARRLINELVELEVSDFRPCFFVRHGSGTDGSTALPAFDVVKTFASGAFRSRLTDGSPHGHSICTEKWPVRQ